MLPNRRTRSPIGYATAIAMSLRPLVVSRASGRSTKYHTTIVPLNITVPVSSQNRVRSEAERGAMGNESRPHSMVG